MSSKRREFLCVEDNNVLHYVVSGDEANIRALAGDPGDVHFPEIELSGEPRRYAKRLLNLSEQPIPIPTLNLDRLKLSDNDAIDFLECHEYFLQMVERINAFVPKLNLQIESHRDLCEECTAAARECISLGRSAAELEFKVQRITDAYSHKAESSCEEPVFFETSWSEGPFSLADMEKIVSSDPTAGSRYHTDGGVTYAEYEANQKASEDRKPQVARPDVNVRRSRILWPIGMAGSVIAVALWLLRLGRFPN